MKRFFSNFAVMVVSATILVGCFGSDNYTSAIPENAAVVLRFDANQMLEKSGTKKEFMNAFRVELQKENLPDFMLAIADDLRNTGVDVESPMYGFVQMDNSNVFVGVVAKTYELELLKKVVERIREDESEISIRECKEGTYVFSEYDKSVVLGYNEEAVILGSVSPANGYGRSNATPYVEKALKAALDGGGDDDVLPEYEDSDVALCIHMNHSVDALKRLSTQLNEPELTTVVAELESVREGRLDYSFNFSDGSIDLEMLATDLPKIFDCDLESCSNDNLDYVPASALAVVNIPFNGESYMKALDKFLNDNKDLKAQLDRELKYATDGAMNSSMMMTVGSPLISSVNGDITLALNDVKETQVWDSYYGYYRKNTIPEASVIVPVENNKIMNLASGYLMLSSDVTKVGGDVYSAKIDGITTFFGQKGDLLFGSTPSILEEAHKPATKASWYDAVEDSYAYAVVNIAGLLANTFVYNELYSELRSEFGSSTNTVMHVLHLLDYFAISAPTSESVKMSIVFKDEDENSLKQIVSIAKSTILSEIF